MKFGIVIGTNEVEVVWNALRFGNTSTRRLNIIAVK